MILVTKSHGIPADRLPAVVAEAVELQHKLKKAVFPDAEHEYALCRMNPAAVDFRVYDEDIDRMTSTYIRREGRVLHIDRAEYATAALAVALASGLVTVSELSGLTQTVSQETGDTGWMSD